MANNLFGRYIWLIDLLYSEEALTLEEINGFWKESPLNKTGEDYPRKTFENHRKAIRKIFGIHINYHRNKGYGRGEDTVSRGTWQIDLEDGAMPSRKEALMSILSLNNTIQTFSDLGDRILYEEEPASDPRWIKLVAAAMKRNVKIKVEYQPFGSEPVTRILAPYCLRMFKRRWYLLALAEKEDGPVLRTYALDSRVKDMKLTDKKFALPKGFLAERYYKDAFGVVVGQVETVRIKAFGVQADYLRTAPLHASQREVETREGWSIFEMTLHADCFDFIQELFSRMEQIEVLSPESLRSRMKAQLEEALKHYE